MRALQIYPLRGGGGGAEARLASHSILKLLVYKRVTSSLPTFSLKVQLCDVNGISLQKKEMRLGWQITRKGKLAWPHPAALCFSLVTSLACQPRPPGVRDRT